MQYIFLYDRHFTGSIYLNKNRICEYLAAVWLCKSAFISISVSDTLCILKSNRKKQQDVIPSTDHHALCNWNCISRENDFTCTGILSRNSNILSRRITAYHCCFINDPWCDHCSKFTQSIFCIQKEFRNDLADIPFILFSLSQSRRLPPLSGGE